MVKSSRIVFFGNERLSSGYSPEGAPTLEALINAGYDIAAVVSNYEKGRSRKPRELEIDQIAQKYDIEVFTPKKVSDIKEELIRLNPQVGILVAFGQIIPQHIIDLFPKGIINIHPSLLPLYRGPTPIEQAILDGAKFSGVSLMGLVKKMDAGPVFTQARLKLDGNESKQELTKKLAKLGADLLLKNLEPILAGKITPKSQDNDRSTYTKLITKSDGLIDLAQPAKIIQRKIRAFFGWPKTRLKIFNDTEIIVLSARIADSLKDGILVLKCGQNTFLEINQLVAPSGRKMSGADFLRGYKRI